MKTLIVFAACIFSYFVGTSQALSWFHSIGHTNGDLPSNLVCSPSGFPIFVGNIEAVNMTVDYDPSTAGSYNVTRPGAYTYVQKIDPAGTLVWAKHIGGHVNTAVARCTDAGTDSAGNLYLVGKYFGIIDFDPGIDTFELSATTVWQTFILKLDSNANFIWCKSIGNANTNNNSSSTLNTTRVAVDNISKIVVSGNFYGILDLDPGSATSIVIGSVASASGYVTVLDTAGNFGWGKRAVSSNNQDLEFVPTCIDPYGNVFVMIRSFTNGVVDGGGGNAYNLPSAANCNIEVVKYNGTGTLVGGISIMSGGGGVGSSLASDKSGNLLVSGSYSFSADFDVSSAGTYIVSTAGNGGFLAKYDTSFALIYAKNIADGPTGDIRATSIQIDNSNDIYIAIPSIESADMDPYGGVYAPPVSAAYSFIVHYDSSMQLKWAKGFKDLISYAPVSLALATSGDVYFNGSYVGTAQQATVTQGLVSHVAVGLTDIYYGKIGQCSPSAAIINVVACNTFVSPSGYYTWTASGVYNDRILNTAGCDSNITINLSVANSTTTNVVANSICSDYNFNGQLLTQSGVYYDTLVSTSGCDSIIALNLTVAAVPPATLQAVSCNSFSFNGNVYNTSGTYLDTFTSALGCDSIVQLSLTIVTANASIVQAGDTLRCVNLAGSYQWINCDPLASIAGETGPFYVPVANGTYAVVITSGGCMDTSACVSVTNVGISKNLWLPMKVYPNPTMQFCNIDHHNVVIQDLQILDAKGQRLQVPILNGRSTSQIDFSRLAAGCYFVRIISGPSVQHVLVTKH
jgi:hypothetical protein